MTFTREQMELMRQWFNAVEDLNPLYLEKQDYELAKTLYDALGMRVTGRMIQVLTSDSQ
jgi:hypothetical protein